ncbi:AAA family ATPase [Candidatus Woesebacteria bacterium]|nr:AAA family ATPase [Candidatus Woesebacteria bacterium]
MSFIRVGGPKGVGKSTIIKEIVGASERLGLPVQKVKGGDHLLDILGVSSYDELRMLPEEVREAARPEMYRRMYEEDRGDPDTIRLRDAHYVMWGKNNDGIVCPTQPEDKEQMLAMVCLTAPLDVIYQRRVFDGREDRHFDENLIKIEIETELEIARCQSREIGCPLVVIENTGNIQESCASLVRETMGGLPYQQELLREFEVRPIVRESELGSMGRERLL